MRLKLTGESACANMVVNSVEPYDVFLCYKEAGTDGERTHDSVLAQDIYEELTAKGLKVLFSRITLKDKLGTAYEPYIFAALNSAKVMLSIGTKPEHFNAVWVKNEWSRYLDFMKNDRKRTLIPCNKDMDPYDMPEEFSNLQAQSMGKIGAMQDLVRGVLKLTGRSDKDTSTVNNTEEIDLLKNSINKLTENETRHKKNIKKLIIGIIAAVIVLGGAAAAAIVFAVPHLNYNIKKQTEPLCAVRTEWFGSYHESGFTYSEYF